MTDAEVLVVECGRPPVFCVRGELGVRGGVTIHGRLPAEDSHGLALYQGQEIYKVQLGNAALSNHLQLQFLWENPAYSRGILHHGWVEVGLYYPNTTGPFVTNGGTPVALDFSTLTFPNSRQADTILQPNLPDVSTFYVIVRVVNSKFVAPPNQPVTNAVLQFYCQVLHA